MRRLLFVLVLTYLCLACSTSENHPKKLQSLPVIASNNLIDIHSQAYDFEQQLTANSQSSATIKLMAGDFVRGMLESSEILADFSLLDDKNQQVRQLINLNKTSGRFLFSAEKSGRYTLVFKAGSQASKVKLSINQVISLQQQDSFEPDLLSPKLNQLRLSLLKGGNTDSFWQQVIKQGTPMVEEKGEKNAIVTFLWRGAKQNVRLFGAPYGGHKELSRLLDSDVWFTSYTMPSDSRLSYQLAPDVPNIPGSSRERKVAILATSQQDPFNKYPIKPYLSADKYQIESGLVLDDSAEQPRSLLSKQNQGTIKEYQITSKILNNSRNISIYTPANFDVTNPEQALLLIFDGKAYQTKVPTPQILDNLIASKKIPATIAVFIDNPNRAARGKELPPNPKFADFMATELLPFIKKRTASIATSENTILSGSSYGGLASSFVAFQYPHLFGAVLAQSASFWWSPKDENGDVTEDQWLTREFAKEKGKSIRFYFNAGIFETGYFPIDILESNRHFRDVLIAKDYSFTYEELSGGHDYFSWREGLSQGLIALFSEKAKHRQSVKIVKQP
ncbi:MAG: DUF3327 domain-containing protein [Alteromonadales bacterium]|nr:DUF3327 domain-containing protein [Alteromonadales bacterium]